MAGRKVGRPKKKKPAPKFRLGKASALPGQLWQVWLQHVLSFGPTWLWVALLLSHVLCLRITEVLTLRARDFQWSAHHVHIGPLKSQPAVKKGMLKALLPVLKSLRENGKSRRRKRKFGARGMKVVCDTWSWPCEKDSYLFPSQRSDSKKPHCCKDTACKAVARARACFKPGRGLFVETEKIRTHSGQHRMINDMKQAQVPQETAMKYARISDVRTFMGYGALSDEQAASGLNENSKLMASLDTMYQKKCTRKKAQHKAACAMKVAK